MKKTLFKRGLASATGALLAVTQFGAMLGTVGAADPLVIDASYLTDVPVEIGVDGLNYTEGSWYNYLTLAYAAGEAVDSTVAMDGVKDAIKNQIGDFLSDEALNAVLAALSDAALTGEGGKYTASAVLAQCGDAAGNALVEVLEAHDKLDIKGAVIDWSGLSIAGTVTVAIDLTADKTIQYTLTFTDETGAVYTASNITDYIGEKLAIALSTIDAATGSTTSVDYADEIANGFDAIEKAKAELNAISINASDFDSAVAAYKDAAESLVAKYADADIPQAAKDKIEALAAKLPDTLSGVLTNDTANAAFNKVIATLNDAQTFADVQLTLADIEAIAGRAYDITVTVDGLAANADFSIDDDQNALLLNSFQDYYGSDVEKLATLSAYFVEEYDLSEGEYTIIEVASHKEIEFAFDGSALKYDIIRVLDSVTLQKAEETTTTPEETTTTPEETTTTPEETTTTPEETTTTPEETTTTPEETTTTTEETTTTTEETTTTTEETTTTTEETTTTTVETTTTSVSYALNVGGLNDVGVYWTEETETFDLSGIEVSLSIFVDGVAVNEILNLHNFIVPAAKNASEIAYDGYGVYDVNVNLTEAGINEISTAVAAMGYDADVLSECGITADNAIGSFGVTLVTRGDRDLSHKPSASERFMDANDFQIALIFYAYVEILKEPDVNAVVAELFDADPVVAAAMHYAADVDADGDVDATDANLALSYYRWNIILGIDQPWSELMDVDAVHDPALHLDPFCHIQENLDEGQFFN